MIKLIGKYLKGAVLFTLIAPLMMILEVSMDLMQPTLMSDIINKGVANGDITYIFDTGKTMLIVALIGVIGGVGCTVFSSLAGTHFGARLRQSMFDHIQEFSFKEIDKLSTSSLITRLTNDVTQLQNMLIMALRMLVRAPMQCIGGVFMAYLLSPKLAVILLIAMPVMFIAVFFVVKKAFPLFSKMQTKIDRVNTVMRENLLGVRVVKAFAGQEHESMRFEKASRDLMDWSMRAGNLTVLLSPIVTFILNLSIVAMFWFGGNMAMRGELEAGTIMALMTYITQVLFSLMMVVMMLMNVSRAKASAERINEVLETRSSITDAAAAKEPNGYDVEFENVSFRYNDTDTGYVLQDISFKAKAGQTVGIIGATGSGKSTLMSLIPRLYDVTKGAIRIGGVDVREIKQETLHRITGMVLQESILFAGTISENLRWADGECDFSVMEQAAKDAQAEEFINGYENKYNAAVEQRARNLSGGQKQRLSIARTFAKRPKILIMDDSTSAVDTATEAKIRKAVVERDKNALTFIIAQRISAIKNADNIIVLDGGRISGIGTHEQLLQNNEIYRAITVSQLGKEAVENVG
ncbi:atp-binding cassette sub-family b [Holotrichia oblita]|nr:atp-binding cassette sub-family b [Holotrichia oblita]